MDTKNFSVEGRYLVYHMLSHLLSLKYGYKKIIEGCYETAINNFKLDRPPEEKFIIVNFVLWKLNSIYNSNGKYGPGY